MQTTRIAVAAVLAAALAAIAVAPSATARARTQDTKIIVMNTVAGHGDNLIISGRLATETRRCRKERKLLVWVTTANGTGPYDGDQSSYRGAWSMIADIDGATGIMIQVYRKKFKNGTVCRGATVDVPFGEPG